MGARTSNWTDEYTKKMKKESTRRLMGTLCNLAKARRNYRTCEDFDLDECIRKMSVIESVLLMRGVSSFDISECKRV